MLNMGGPESKEQVPDYMKNMFLDRDLIRLPFLQNFLGPKIAMRRINEIWEKYEEIGSYSPTNYWVPKQGKLLEKKLDQLSPETAPHKCLASYRYIEPSSPSVIADLEDCEHPPENVIIFSQYPQYACCTAGSSLKHVAQSMQQLQRDNLDAELDYTRYSVIDGFHDHPLFVDTWVESIKKKIDEAEEKGFGRDDIEIVFSAHGMPVKNIERGDQYEKEIKNSINLVMKELVSRHGAYSELILYPLLA